MMEDEQLPNLEKIDGGGRVGEFRRRNRQLVRGEESRRGVGGTK